MHIDVWSDVHLFTHYRTGTTEERTPSSSRCAGCRGGPLHGEQMQIGMYVISY